MFHKWKWWINC